MANRTVSLRIVADAGTAKETLDRIAAQTDDLEHKRTSITVNVHDGDTKAQLDEITAKADALGIKSVSFKIKADASQAKREMAETAAEADGLRAKVKSMADGESAGENATKLLTTGLMALAPAILPVGAAAVSVGGALAASFTAAGAGLGVFGMVAKSAYAGISTQLQAYKADQIAADTATTNKARLAAIAKEKTAFNGLTSSQKQFAGSIISAQNAWQGFVNTATPGVTKVLNSGLKLLPEVFRAMQPFLAPTEHALQGIIGMIGKGLNSKGFQTFTDDLAKHTGPAITDIAIAVGNLGKGFGHLLEDFLPMSDGVMGGLDKLTGGFAKWAASASVSNGIRGIFDYFRSNGPALLSILKQLPEDVAHIVSALKGWGSLSLSGIKVILQVIGKLSPGQLQAIAIGFLAIRAATALWRIAMIALNIVMNLNPFILILTAVAIAVLLIVKYHKQLAAVAKAVWHDVTAFAVDAFNGIKRIFDDVFGFIKSHWQLILGILTGPIGLAAVAIIHYWRDISGAFVSAWRDIVSFFHSAISTIRNGAAQAIDNVVTFFRQLPGRIVSALSSLAGMLVNVGYNAVMGLLHGVENAAGGVLSYVSNLAHDISSAFSSVLHIFSPSRVFYSHGKNIVLGIANAIRDHSGLAVAATTDLGRSISGALHVSSPGFGSAGGASGNVTNNFNITGMVTNPDAVARQIAQMLNDYNRHNGKQPVFA